MSTEPETPAPFEPYTVDGVGTVTAHEGDIYVVAALNGSVYGYKSQSGAPAQDKAADEIAYAIANPPALPEAPRELSKLTLRRRLRGLGVEDSFDALLDGLPHARADWDDAQVLLTTDPLFTEYAGQIRDALGITQEQWGALIA